MVLTRRLIRRRLSSGEELWLNTVTGAVDKLSEAEVSLAEKAACGNSTTGDELIARLESRGYLYPDEGSEEDAFVRLIDEQTSFAKNGKTVKHLIICPTYSCNLRCIYCFERSAGSHSSNSPMDVSTASLAMEAFTGIRSLDPGQHYSLGLFGGEPLLMSNRTVVAYILERAKQDSLPVMIVTNGVSVSEYVSLLEEYLPFIGAVQLTLDGPEEVHDRRRPTAGGRGTYQAVAAAADVLLGAGIRVVLRVNIDRENVRYLPIVTEIAGRHGWTGNPLFSCSLSPVRDHCGRGDVPNVTPEGELLSSLLDVYDQYPETERLFGYAGFQVLSHIASILPTVQPNEPAPGPRVFNCEANHGGFYVAGPDGYLYACPEAISQPELAIGRFAPKLDLWQSAINKWVDRSIGTLADCHDCGIGPLCGGGCTYASMVRFGDSSRPVCDPALKEAVEVFMERRLALL